MDEHHDEEGHGQHQQREQHGQHAADGAGPGDDEASPKRTGFTVTDRRFWAQGEEEAKQAEAERARLPTYVEQLRTQLEEKDKQLRDYIAAYKREVVEGLEKTKQRLERDAAREKERERGELARPMMEVLDALERSLAAGERAAAGSGADVQAMLQGLRMVHLLMVQKLQELGFTRIETGGRAFDPALHEASAVVAVSDPALDRMITAELRPGFLLGERVIRPALVQVGRLQS